MQAICHWKYVAVYIITLFLFLGFQRLTRCAGKRYTHALCAQYEKLAVAGSLCADICRLHTVRLSYCTPESHGFRIFHNDSLDLKVDSSLLVNYDIQLDLSEEFAQPMLGVTVPQFTDMLTQFVDSWLGPGDHADLVNDLITFADSDRDNKLSLAEAKSLRALVKHREFFVSFVLRHTTVASPFRGFCGNMFATSPLPVSPLYWLPAPSSWYFPLLAPVARAFWPSWPRRAKHAIELLEFATEIYAKENGSFYICDFSPALYGVDDRGNVKLTSWSHVYSYHELQRGGSVEPCGPVPDCTTEECRSVCGGNHKCLVSVPGLATVCTLLMPYLLPRAPRVIAADVARLLTRCVAMNMTATGFAMEHAVVSNELKSLLWRSIASDVS